MKNFLLMSCGHDSILRNRRRELFHNNFQRVRVEMEDVNWIKAPTEIGELGRWDKHVNYHDLTLFGMFL